MNVQLGHTYRDKITGLTGIATGLVQYITGYNQVLIAPRAEKASDMPTAHWVDEQRLEHLPEAEAVIIENGSNPGCDLQAPVR